MRRSTLLFFALLVCFMAGAKQRNQKEALQIASRYIKTSSAVVCKVRGTATITDTAAYYAFNATSGHGFVIVSGDDAMADIVGYCAEGSFDDQDMPPAMQAYLDQYTQYINKVRVGNSNIRRAVLDENPTPVVSPLVTTKWDQHNPYNLLCPVIKDANGTPMHSFTGCSATAAAQIMNFYQFPIHGVDEFSYNSSSLGKPITTDFRKSTYDWANMNDTYVDNNWTLAQSDAVSLLMRDVQRAIKSEYYDYGTDAINGPISYGLPRHFGYNCNYVIRDAVGSAVFLAKIKEWLDARHPVEFTATGRSFGHSFVVDGYDTNDFLHVNWGWSGKCDGYFNMNYMDSHGDDGNYRLTTDQSAYLFTPGTEGVAGHEASRYLTIWNQLYNYDGVFDGNLPNGSIQHSQSGNAYTITVNGLVNQSEEDWNGEVALRVWNESTDTIGAVTTMKLPGTATQKNATFTVSLADSTLFTNLSVRNNYFVSLATRESGSSEWKPVKGIEYCEYMLNRDQTVSFDNGAFLELNIVESMKPDRDTTFIENDHSVHFSYTLCNKTARTFTGMINYLIVDDEWVNATYSPSVAISPVKRVRPVILPAPQDSCMITVYGNSLYEGQFTLNLDQANLVPNKTYYALPYQFKSVTGDEVNLIYENRYEPFTIRTNKNIIKLATLKAVGDTVSLMIKSTGDYTVHGATRLAKDTTRNDDDRYYYAVKQQGAPINECQPLAVTGDVTTFSCYKDSVIGIDVSGDSVLTDLRTSENFLTTLDVSHNPELLILACATNYLSSIDLSKNTKLEEFDGYKNNFTSLDISHCKLLKNLNIYDNQLKAIDLSPCTNLQYVMLDDNPLTSVIIGEQPKLQELACQKMPLLDSLNVSGCKKLQKLWIANSKFKSVNLNGCNDLLWISAWNNQFDSIDVSQCPSLQYLNIAQNNLTSLDLSHNSKLGSIYCTKNKLTSLDLSRNAILHGVYLADNNIKGENMDRTIASLPDCNEQSCKQYADLVAIDQSNPEEANVMTVEQVAAAFARGWITWAYTSYEDQKFEKYPGSAPVGVNSVKAQDNNIGSGAVYDIAGRRITTSDSESSTLRKGMYLMNGKKVVVR